MSSKFSMPASAIERIFAYWIDKLLIFSGLLGGAFLLRKELFRDMSTAVEKVLALSTGNLNWGFDDNLRLVDEQKMREAEKLGMEVIERTPEETREILRETFWTYWDNNPDMVTFLWLFLIAMIIYFVYSVVMELTPLKATLGKYLLGSKVESMDGEKASVVGVVLRNLIKAIPLFGIITMLFSLFNKKRYAIHDLLTKTAVNHR